MKRYRVEILRAYSLKGPMITWAHDPDDPIIGYDIIGTLMLDRETRSDAEEEGLRYALYQGYSESCLVVQAIEIDGTYPRESSHIENK